ncbi:PIN domain-containing protein [Candidatus Bathyarchaeota archaeon]|nr:PIN domain-containing protein [Candidatus Bathyarchaeota archaeon]MBS7612816.1 PIN domain-containing protein [Candidatus Bathyarchaeota archaeon]
MILDTTYLLPLTRIDIDTDLLQAIAKGKTNVKLEEICINLISIFELQAKAAKLGIPAKFMVKAVEAILKAFRVESFYNPEIVEVSYELRKLIPDYIDCVIVATAAVLKEDLVTEDSLILAKKDAITEKYGVKVLSFKDIVK